MGAKLSAPARVLRSPPAPGARTGGAAGSPLLRQQIHFRRFPPDPGCVPGPGGFGSPASAPIRVPSTPTRSPCLLPRRRGRVNLQVGRAPGPPGRSFVGFESDFLIDWKSQIDSDHQLLEGGGVGAGKEMKKWVCLGLLEPWCEISTAGGGVGEDCSLWHLGQRRSRQNKAPQQALAEEPGLGIS